VPTCAVSSAASIVADDSEDDERQAVLMRRLLVLDRPEEQLEAPSNDNARTIVEDARVLRDNLRGQVDSAQSRDSGTRRWNRICVRSVRATVWAARADETSCRRPRGSVAASASAAAAAAVSGSAVPPTGGGGSATKTHSISRAAAETATDGYSMTSTYKLSTAARRFTCPICDYSTGHKSNLDRHLRRHIGRTSPMSLGREFVPQPPKSPAGFVPFSPAAMAANRKMPSPSFAMEVADERDNKSNGVKFSSRHSGWWPDMGVRSCNQGCNGCWDNASRRKASCANVAWPFRRPVAGGGYDAAARRKRYPTYPTLTTQSTNRMNADSLLKVTPQLPFPLPPGLFPFIDQYAAAKAALEFRQGRLPPAKLGDIAAILQAIEHLHQQQQQLHYRPHQLNQSGNTVTLHENFSGLIPPKMPRPAAMQPNVEGGDLFRNWLSAGLGRAMYNNKNDRFDENEVGYCKQEHDNVEETVVSDDCTGADKEDEEEEIEIEDDEDTMEAGESSNFSGPPSVTEAKSRRGEENGNNDEDDTGSDGHGESEDSNGSESRPRCRLLPLLHTCRTCAVTFSSQLQLKIHSDVCHQSEEAVARDAIRPITSQSQSPQQQRRQQQQPLLSNH
jgi:hypothetical protein